MKRWNRFTTINDLMYAIVVGGALVLSALGLADELFNLRSERILAATVYAWRWPLLHTQSCWRNLRFQQ